jgi:hypothetical protein
MHTPAVSGNDQCAAIDFGTVLYLPESVERSLHEVGDVVLLHVDIGTPLLAWKLNFGQYLRLSTDKHR